MSDRAQAAQAAAAWSRRPLAGIGGGGGTFAQDRRFARHGPLHSGDHGDDGGGAAPDPLAAAWEQGYAAGAAEARATAAVEAASADAARHRIESALARLDADALDQFRQRLRATVLALCEAVLADAARDPATLARRVEAAAAMFARAADERVIRLNPEDLALIHARLPEDWHCEPDPTVERGALRVESAQGGVEDGPAQWRRALEEALGAC